MHTTSPWRAVSRVALVLGLFFTGCCFFRQLALTVLFQFPLPVVKLILSFVIPAAVTVWNFLTERSLRFAGTACAVLMQVSLVLFFIDRYTVNLIARLDDSRIIYHFLYTLISVFTLLAAGWICARCSKACVDFALFYRRFSLGYLPLCVFLFYLAVFSAAHLWQYFRYRQQRTLPGRDLLPVVLCQDRHPVFFHRPALGRECAVLYLPVPGPLRHGAAASGAVGHLVPVALSVFVESFQLLTKSGDADVDDIILNTLGAVLGVLIFRVLLRPVPCKRRPVYVRHYRRNGCGGPHH